MRFNSKSLGFVVNFLLGVSWAIMLIGAYTSFTLNYTHSILFGLFSAIMGAIPGLIAIILLEHFITNQEKLYELKKQTKLLSRLIEKREERR